MPSDTTIRKNLLRAKAAASLSDVSKHQLGAVLVLGNKVLSVGYNITRTHPLQKEYNLERGYNPDARGNGAIHAEMMCLLSTRYLDVDWSKATLYIYREHKDGTSALAKPCPACDKAIRDRGIGKVYYSTEEDKNYFPYNKLRHM